MYCRLQNALIYIQLKCSQYELNSPNENLELEQFIMCMIYTQIYPVDRDFSSVSEELELNVSSSLLKKLLIMGRMVFCEWKNTFGR